MTAVDTPRDAKAWELMQTAHQLIQQGDWAAAAAALEAAAALHGEAGRSYDEARCLQSAATLRRSAGDTETARVLGDQAAAVPTEDATLAVSIASERAETAFTQGRYEDAVRLWVEAIGKARLARANAEGLSAMLRRLAVAQLAAHEKQSAAASFAEAEQLIEQVMGPEAAGFVRGEQAGLLLQYGDLEGASKILDAVQAGSSAHLRAELNVLRARAARATGHPGQALKFALVAREAALEAIAPVSYFGATVELAAALEEQGKRADAYGALAAAWATLEDLLGGGVARSWVEPVLMAYRMKWGDAAFSESRRAYEASRRAAKGEAQRE